MGNLSPELATFADVRAVGEGSRPSTSRGIGGQPVVHQVDPTRYRGTVDPTVPWEPPPFQHHLYRLCRSRTIGSSETVHSAKRQPRSSGLIRRD